MRGAAINEPQQTTNNLAMVAAVFARSAALINEMTIIPSTVSFAGYVYNSGLSPAFYLSPSSDSTGPGQHIRGPATME